MMANTISSRLLIVMPLFWLAGCSTTATRSDAPAPVVDHSVAPAQSAPGQTTTAVVTTPDVPVVKVQPLPRQLPLEPEPQISMAPPTPKPKPKPTVTTATTAPRAAPADAATQVATAATKAPVQNAPEAVVPPPRPKTAVRDVTPPPADLAPKQGNQAVQALLNSARKHVAGSDWDKAGADLERALRIEPKNAGIWHDLSQIPLAAATVQAGRGSGRQVQQPVRQ